MLNGFWDPILQFIEKQPVLFGLFGIILGSILAPLWPWIGSSIARFTKFLWMKMRGKGADHHFETIYLDWLIREHRHLGLLPAQLVARRWKDRQKLGQLEQIYVKLAISAQSDDERWAETYRDGENSWCKQPWIVWRFIKSLLRFLLPSVLSSRMSIFTEQTYQPGDLGLVIDRHKRLVIRGDPGSGKTTLLRYLAVTCARTLRNNRRDGDSHSHVKKRLLWTTHPFPIFVRLRRHGNVANWDEAKELTNAMLEELPSELKRRCPPDFFEQRLCKGRCLILLDAFDELGTPDARAAMARKIAGFLEVYKRDDNRIVITTRIVGYEGQLDQYDFMARTVQNLKAGEIRALVKQRYNAIALAETTLRPDQESRDIEQKMRERAERLIEKIEHTPRLNQLATNPMLLSLIVLVHSLKIELPEERLLLYRDCVEILTESWQQFKREELGLKREEREELTLNQKLILLRELAFAMQQQRKDEGSLALIPKDEARDIIARKLPDFLARASAGNEAAKKVAFEAAEAWIASIQGESGILVEQGLDEDGEPLIGFSHLTFQEYLAAVAIHEEPAYQSLLWRDLLQPAWQEVVLLYAALANHATPLIHILLTASQQPHGVLLAGRCIAERLKKVDADARQRTVEKLKDGFVAADDETASEFAKVMSLLREREITTFLRQQLSNSSLQKRIAVATALGQTRDDSPELEQVRADLVQIVETSREKAITIAAREALAGVGDPRFIGPEAVLVRVPKQPENAPALMRTWKDVKASAEWMKEKRFRQRFSLLARVMDYWLFTRWCTMRKRPWYGYEFEIGKYPVTNMEYYRFIEATQHPAPISWKEGTFPREEATHPVTGITRKDAQVYCAWLSARTGKKYRLPTAWEWEWAAAGPQGWRYPWGNQFDPDKCNTKESRNEGTTPVGSYVDGNSFCGASDMIGNVWEITLGKQLAEIVAEEGATIAAVAAVVSVSVAAVVAIAAGEATISIILAVVAVVSVVVAVVAALAGEVLTGEVVRGEVLAGEVVRGGAWNTSSNEATCLFREGFENVRVVGFRCLREVDASV